MLREGIRRVIIADNRGRMVGIVTATDVLQLLARVDTTDEAAASSWFGKFRPEEASASASAPI
jgi:signal-transduction protein with cAMP-binding, CBS, and nucleotidyltransferase domain